MLVIDDQSKTAELLGRLAPELELLTIQTRAEGPSRFHARSWDEAAPWIEARRPPDVVVLDLRFDLPDEELLPDQRPLGQTAQARRVRRERRERQGLFILERLRRRRPEIAVLLTTAYEEIPFEEEALALKADAFTYAAAEDETASGLVAQLRRILEERSAPQRTGRFFWGSSLAMRALRRKVMALAPTPMPLLLTGPTGTGKSLLVRDVIHPLSGRSGAFVPFDCATVPEGLLQAALFGTLRGAFTGAVADRPGVFESAAEGTLFLDEVENLTADSQKMLLTALNDGTIRRLGASAETPLSARVLAASNTDLVRRAAAGGFRSDLLMRLNPSLALELPPLSQRREDLPELARATTAAFVANARHRRAIASLVRAAGGGEPEGEFPLSLPGGDTAASREAPVVFTMPPKAWRAMLRHPWPGNLRQFEMTLTDALAAAVYAGEGASRDRTGRSRIALDARLLFDLLAGARGAEPAPDRLSLERPRVASVAAFRRELERSTLRALFREAGGDFERMAEAMTGSRREARAVRLRFNKLGLSARDER